MKIIAIGGVPCSGKTTLVNDFRKTLGHAIRIRWKTLRFEQYEREKIFILGVYSGAKFDGTDQLSMSVQPDAASFLDLCSKNFNDYTLIFEGDRLFNVKFLTTCVLTHTLTPIVLTTTDQVTRQRKRGTFQRASFLKSRQTKIDNICKAFQCIVIDSGKLDKEKFLPSMLPLKE